MPPQSRLLLSEHYFADAGLIFCPFQIVSKEKHTQREMTDPIWKGREWCQTCQTCCLVLPRIHLTQAGLAGVVLMRKKELHCELCNVAEPASGELWVKCFNLPWFFLSFRTPGPLKVSKYCTEKKGTNCFSADDHQDVCRYTVNIAFFHCMVARFVNDSKSDGGQQVGASNHLSSRWDLALVVWLSGPSKRENSRKVAVISSH